MQIYYANAKVNVDSINLADGSILVSTNGGAGGNITLEIAENLILKDNSLISARAFEDANGGNISIDSQFVIAFPSQTSGNGNDIIANAERGNGGNINIRAESLLGIEDRPLNDATNDINASSEFSLDGNVTISTPDINPVQGTTELSSNVVVPDQTTTQACRSNREETEQNGLTISGKGGIPSAPELPLDSQRITINGENNTQQISTTTELVQTSQGKIQPARGINITESGEVILTAYRTENTGDRVPKIRRNCD